MESAQIGSASLKLKRQQQVFAGFVGAEMKECIFGHKRQNGLSDGTCNLWLCHNHEPHSQAFGHALPNGVACHPSI